MEFSTVVVIVLVAAIGYVLYKAFVKRADTNQDGVVTAEEAKAEVAKVEEEVKVAVAKVEEEVKVVATKAKATAAKAKATVKKATTRKPKASK